MSTVVLDGYGYAIDAAINQHLGVSLGLAESDAAKLPPLGSNLGGLTEHLRANNPRIASADQMLKTTPPGQGSHLIRFDTPDPAPGELERDVDGIDELELENRSALDEIRIALDSRTRDWRIHQRHTNEFHRRNAARVGQHPNRHRPDDPDRPALRPR